MLHSRQPAVEKAPSRPCEEIRNLLRQEIESGIQNIQKEITQQTEAVKKEYHFPPLKLLKNVVTAAHRGDSDGQSSENGTEVAGYAAQFQVSRLTVTRRKLWSYGYPL